MDVYTEGKGRGKGEGRAVDVYGRKREREGVEGRQRFKGGSRENVSVCTSVYMSLGKWC